MKKIFILCIMASACLLNANAQFGKIKIDPTKVTKAATDVAKAITLTDADVAALCQEYIDWVDEHNPVCEIDSKDAGMKAYADRLHNLVKDHTREDGMKLDIKAYYVVDQNAFACANGSIRVFAGLMDMLTDDELLGVIGHEMGHIKNTDSKDAMKQAYMTSAAKSAVASTGSVAQALTDSELGALGEALAGAQYSQKQEYAADDYGYNFLKKSGYDSKGMASALRKIQQLQDDAGMDKSKVKALFSSHPDSAKRAERLEKKDN